MRKQSIPLLLVIALAVVATACGGTPEAPERPDSGDSGHDAAPDLDIPDDILADFRALPMFAATNREPSDVFWRVYRKEGGHRVVAATYMAENPRGELVPWYFFGIYGPEVKSGSPERVLTKGASLEETDFNVAAGITQKPNSEGVQVRFLAVTGMAQDARITKVTVETSTGRKFDARWYDRFWVVFEPLPDPSEKYLRSTAYGSDGSELYRIPKVAPPPSPR